MGGEKSVLVTGGAGFIGSHVVDRLSSMGIKPIVVDNISAASSQAYIRKMPGEIKLYTADIRDAAEIESVFDKHPTLDAVIHLAACADIAESMKRPAKEAAVNVGGTLNVLTAAKNHNVRRFIFSSSAAVYGNPEYVPVDEAHPKEPTNSYGVSKFADEGYIRVHGNKDGISSVVFRFGNVYGPRQATSVSGEGAVVPTFMTAALNNEPPTLRGEGKAIRDYIFVKDVANALCMALDCSPGTYNLGTGAGTSVQEVWTSISDAFKVKGHEPPEYRTAPLLPGEVETMILSAARANIFLSWRPQVDFRSGIGEAVEYFLFK